jgi:hypothetical protein
MYQGSGNSTFRHQVISAVTVRLLNIEATLFHVEMTVTRPGRMPEQIIF